jgi:predicted dinucleotide-utilizing enzyme
MRSAFLKLYFTTVNSVATVNSRSADVSVNACRSVVSVNACRSVVSVSAFQIVQCNQIGPCKTANITPLNVSGAFLKLHLTTVNSVTPVNSRSAVVSVSSVVSVNACRSVVSVSAFQIVQCNQIGPCKIANITPLNVSGAFLELYFTTVNSVTPVNSRSAVVSVSSVVSVNACRSVVSVSAFQVVQCNQISPCKIANITPLDMRSAFLKLYFTTVNSVTPVNSRSAVVSVSSVVSVNACRSVVSVSAFQVVQCNQISPCKIANITPLNVSGAFLKLYFTTVCAAAPRPAANRGNAAVWCKKS